MSGLAFSVLDATADAYAVTPTLIFRLRVEDAGNQPASAVALRCQIRIEPQRRGYSDEEAAGLVDLFGGRDRWRDTARPFLFAHATAMLRGFTGSLEFDLPVTCTYDFEVAASKYLHAVRDGEVPLTFLFSGTVFRPVGDGATAGTGFGVEQVPWHLEASYRLPVATWRTVMDRYFPNSGWIRLDVETLDALVRYRSAQGLPSWERTMESLLTVASEMSR